MTARSSTLGFEGHEVELLVDLPDGTATPWDAKANLRWVGAPVPRLDGVDKVSGRARYTTDVRLAGMLYAEVVRSPHPAAKLLRIDVSAAEAMQGTAAVHVLAKPGDMVRYEGQELAVVAADTLHHARDAVRAVVVEYDVLEHVTDLERAMSPDAPTVFADAQTTPGANKLPVVGNVRGPASGGRRFQGIGDVEAGMAGATHRIEATYRTQVQTHSCLEPHGAVVAPTPEGGFEVWTSTQSIASVVKDVARSLGIPSAKVHVHCDYLGGGFGSKFGAGIYTVAAAHLARKTGKPVRLVLDRRAEHLAGGNRPSSLQKVRIGATADGTLTALDVTSWGSAGVGTGAGAAAPYHVIYDVPHRKSAEYDVFTHTGAAAAFRAPGHPQGVFALESALDELAERMGLDPIDLRLRNDSHPVRRMQWSMARERFGWDALRQKPRDVGRIRRGVGAAASVWYNIVETGVGALVELHRDGSVAVKSAVQDIGGGIRTVIAQVAAEVLGLAPHDVQVHIGDSAWPVGPGSGGSKTTASLTPAVHRAVEVAARKLAALTPELGDAASISFRDGSLVGPGGNAVPFRAACARMREAMVVGHGERGDDMEGIAATKDEPLRRLATFIAGVQLASVAVDTETGVVRVEKVLAVQDCGRVMNPLQARGQINGGIIQGLSYALYEERVLDPLTGRMLNANLDQYRIAGMQEIPEIDVVLTNVYTGLNSTGAMGLGEPATVPTSAAVANAVAHAMGARIRSLPMTPERVLAALGDVR